MVKISTTCRQTVAAAGDGSAPPVGVRPEGPRPLVAVGKDQRAARCGAGKLSWQWTLMSSQPGGKWESLAQTVGSPCPTLNGLTQTLSDPCQTLKGLTRTVSGLRRTLNGLTQTLRGPSQTLRGPSQTLNGLARTVRGPRRTVRGLTQTLNGLRPAFE